MKILKDQYQIYTNTPLMIPNRVSNDPSPLFTPIPKKKNFNPVKNKLLKYTTKDISGGISSHEEDKIDNAKLYNSSLKNKINENSCESGSDQNENMKINSIDEMPQIFNLKSYKDQKSKNEQKEEKNSIGKDLRKQKFDLQIAKNLKVRTQKNHLLRKKVIDSDNENNQLQYPLKKIINDSKVISQ